MSMQMNQMYGAKREPIDLPTEAPTLVAELLQRHRDDLGYTVDEMAAIVRMNVDDFEEA